MADHQSTTLRSQNPTHILQVISQCRRMNMSDMILSGQSLTISALGLNEGLLKLNMAEESMYQQHLHMSDEVLHQQVRLHMSNQIMYQQSLHMSD